MAEELSPYAPAISGIESGGRYDALGPLTHKGDRAYGKYQIMGANIPEWTKAALGKSLTPAEFLANEKAQEDTFRHRFGLLADKHGPEGAARAWFAGEGGMNNPNAKDALGTTVAKYAAMFNRALGGQQPAQAEAPQGAGILAQAPVAQAPAADTDSPLSGILAGAMTPRQTQQPEFAQAPELQIRRPQQPMQLPTAAIQQAARIRQLFGILT